MKPSTINLDHFGYTSLDRVNHACLALTQGKAVLLMDDPNRENEGDLIVAADLITTTTMNQMIVDGSGIVCLALSQSIINQLELTPMVSDNSSKNKTAFTVSIEAKQGVTTGVSAADRVQTVKTAVKADAKPQDLARPGHVFPLVSENGGVLKRRGHTEGGVDLCTMAGLAPAAVLCELMNKDGTMMKGLELVEYAKEHHLVLLTIADIVEVIKQDTGAVA